MKKLKTSSALSWIVYILKCSDKSLYTGITNDLERRVKDHNSGKGAKYTRGRAPLKVVYTEKHKNRSTASKREAEIKAMKKSEKVKLWQKK